MNKPNFNLIDEIYDTSIHLAMVQDKIRVNSYIESIKKNKIDFYNKIIVDIGAGSGILSVIALLELHKAAINLQGNSFKFIELLALQAMLYLPLVLGTSFIASYLQKSKDDSTNINLAK